MKNKAHNVVLILTILQSKTGNFVILFRTSITTLANYYLNFQQLALSN